MTENWPQMSHRAVVNHAFAAQSVPKILSNVGKSNRNTAVQERQPNHAREENPARRTFFKIWICHVPKQLALLGNFLPVQVLRLILLRFFLICVVFARKESRTRIPITGLDVGQSSFRLKARVTMKCSVVSYID